MFALLMVASSTIIKTLSLAANLAQVASLFVGHHTKAVASRAARRVKAGAQRVRHASKRVRERVRRPKGKISLNERFTDVADLVSQKIGEWPVTAISLGLMVVWIILGPLQGFSNTWQLEANTPTTWIELFIGFLCAAATNRAEKHLHKLLGRITLMETANAKMEREHGEMIKAMHEMLTDLHGHTQCQGHTIIAGPADAPTPARPRRTPTHKPAPATESTTPTAQE